MTDDEIADKLQTHSHRYWRIVVATTQYLVDGVQLPITATAMSSTETETDNDGPIRTRKRQCHVDQWKAVIAKRARNKGEEYKTLHGNALVPARSVGPLCKCGCMNSIGNENVKVIFDNFWKF